MTPEARRLAQLAGQARRRRNLVFALHVLAVAVALAALAPPAWGLTGRLAAGLVGGFLAGSVVRWLFPGRRLTGDDYARHLDAAHPELQESTELLLDRFARVDGLASLQRREVSTTFLQLDRTGALAATLPPLPLRRLARTWGIAVIVTLAATTWHGYRNDTDPASMAENGLIPGIQSARIRLTPPDYLGVPAGESDRMDFDTFEGTRVEWSMQLTGRADSVALHFHDGETLTLERNGAMRWRSTPWTARSTVYRVQVDGQDLPRGIFRIDAQQDAPPRLTVRTPDRSLRTVAVGPAPPDLRLRFEFEAVDDYGIVDTQARITLARGTGEQVRFREQAVPLEFDRDQDGRRIDVSHEFDLLALGMEPGDELYLFAEVTDNRAGEPNVGSSGTYIVRWPDEDDIAGTPVANVVLSVLPEFFRSQRQIIIDTERLLAERNDLAPMQFAQRAQGLASDQKLLRLRYGQYLGEEDDSGIGVSVQAMAPESGAHADDAGRVDHDHGAAGSARDDHSEHGHAAQARAADGADPARGTGGDADAAIALYGHFHDTEEQATLFDPKTRDLLKSALAQMWDAELHLRLADPEPALPFEYAALGLIKQVQQGSRVYLRRAGFRPTPVDENRRLSGELDDIVLASREHDRDAAGDMTRLRALLTSLTSKTVGMSPLIADLAALEPTVADRSASDPQWLPALGALQRLRQDPGCDSCRDDLVRALWRQLDGALAVPSAGLASAHPLAEAYRRRIDSPPRDRTDGPARPAP